MIRKHNRKVYRDSNTNWIIVWYKIGVANILQSIKKDYRTLNKKLLQYNGVFFLIIRKELRYIIRFDWIEMKDSHRMTPIITRSNIFGLLIGSFEKLMLFITVFRWTSTNIGGMWWIFLEIYALFGILYKIKILIFSSWK